MGLESRRQRSRWEAWMGARVWNLGNTASSGLTARKQTQTGRSWRGRLQQWSNPKCREWVKAVDGDAQWSEQWSRGSQPTSPPPGNLRKCQFWSLTPDLGNQIEGLGSRREGALLQPAPGDAREAGGLGATCRSAKWKLWGPKIPVPSLCAIDIRAGESEVGGGAGPGLGDTEQQPWSLPSGC